MTSFDFEATFFTWNEHYWLLPSYAWYLEFFCAEGTAETLCSAPIDGGPNHNSTLSWCIDLYNSTGCSAVQEEAQTDMAIWSYSFMTSLGALGCAVCVLLLLILRFVKRLINNPYIILRSQNKFVPVWLMTPTIVSFFVAAYFKNEGGEVSKDTSAYILKVSD